MTRLSIFFGGFSFLLRSSGWGLLVFDTADKRVGKLGDPDDTIEKHRCESIAILVIGLCQSSCEVEEVLVRIMEERLGNYDKESSIFDNVNHCPFVVTWL